MKKLAILLVLAMVAPALATIGDIIEVDLTPTNPGDITLGGEWRVGFDEPWKTYCAQRTDRPPGQGEFWQYTGSGTATINYSLPAAEYKLRWYGAPASWASGSSWEFSIGGTGVSEAGTLYPNQLHTLWPTNTSSEPVVKAELIGPSMASLPDALTITSGGPLHIGTSQWQGSDNYPGTSLFLEAGNQVVITFVDNDAGNYGRIMSYGFEFEEIGPIPEPATIGLLTLGGLALLRRRK